MKKYSLTLIATGFIGLSACAHTEAERRIDEKLAAESPVANRQQLSSNAGSLIASAPDLSAEQRAELIQLRDSTARKTDELRARSFKLRELLVSEVIASTYDDTEVSLVKKRLEATENERLQAIFTAVDKANAILGRQAALHPEIMTDVIEGHGEAQGARSRD
jgi:hypothetical protein